MSQPDAAHIVEWQEAAYGLFATNCVGIAGFSMLIWDHIITFGDEVNVIWKRPSGRKNGQLIYLFIILRYFAPLAYIVQLCSYFLPPNIWTPEICGHYVVFEGSVIVTSLGLVALMMMIRVYALYARDKRVLAFVIALFILQFSVQGWLLSRTHAVPHPQGLFHIAGCSMLFDESLGGWPTASAWLPVVYDTAIFVLTVYKTAHVLRRRDRKARPTQGSWISRTLLRDGALYYFAIIASNIPLIIMLSAAPDSIRNIAAQLECLYVSSSKLPFAPLMMCSPTPPFSVTVTMMSRITLSLRREDTAWQVGTVLTDHMPGGGDMKTTIHFAGADKKNRDADEASIWTSSEFDFDPGERSRSSFASSSTLVSNSYAENGGTWRLARPGMPTPIVESQEEEVELDYFQRSPTSAVSSRVEGMFKPYSQESFRISLNRATGGSSESLASTPCSPTWALSSPRRRLH
ncbi:hypothetical protein EXIGLDRAFT_829505 [Exidia glandulosa HHB12029]|uniref:DUF6533 domain-containing protein n=1 Tax=Exidia glandulosa HHB12029 TaxID=1314781 RepID=A0A165PKX2_EXIGL|nr:hypothetical protein EXIGLDRAFT_829505 [Exidia glandulosa HHB12029]